MKWITTVVVFTTTTLATLLTGGPPVAGDRQPVSTDQYRILTRQCGYADTAQARRDCRAEVGRRYVVGARSDTLDCRTYAGITVCGVIKLGEAEKKCLRTSMASGITYRRAEVECYALA
ncbi:hypothetical protein Sru01_32000 [Sphaerisporangium rufum]|uniref:Uncharacterized protein n=1 Tax=Sphaerisporangium rufum TaxID=1381558 RepID=A0A919R373_9ACTN|nr:hypothetical protein [Sphaerisporangium rufum]GII78218.1 hypothetical protein Sru01_32000 [Sphaerisporangium rufum]